MNGNCVHNCERIAILIIIIRSLKLNRNKLFTRNHRFRWTFYTIHNASSSSYHNRSLMQCEICRLFSFEKKKKRKELSIASARRDCTIFRPIKFSRNIYVYHKWIGAATTCCGYRKRVIFLKFIKYAHCSNTNSSESHTQTQIACIAWPHTQYTFIWQFYGSAITIGLLFAHLR